MSEGRRGILCGLGYLIRLTSQFVYNARIANSREWAKVVIFDLMMNKLNTVFPGYVFGIFLICFSFKHSAQINNYRILADSLFSIKEYKMAGNYYGKDIISDKSDNIYYSFYARAYCYYYLKEYEKSVLDIKEALKIEDNNQMHGVIKGNSYWLYAKIFSKKNKKGDALSYLKEAAIYLKRNSLLYSTIGYLETQLEKYDDAMLSLNLSLNIDSTNSYGFSNRSFLNLKLKRINNAKEDVEKSIKLNSINPYAFKHRALIYIYLNEFNAACFDLKKSIDLGYKTFDNESNLEDVDKLLRKYCK